MAAILASAHFAAADTFTWDPNGYSAGYGAPATVVWSSLSWSKNDASGAPVVPTVAWANGANIADFEAATSGTITVDKLFQLSTLEISGGPAWTIATDGVGGHGLKAATAGAGGILNINVNAAVSATISAVIVDNSGTNLVIGGAAGGHDRSQRLQQL